MKTINTILAVILFSPLVFGNIQAQNISFELGSKQLLDSAWATEIASQSLFGIQGDFAIDALPYNVSLSYLNSSKDATVDGDQGTLSVSEKRIGINHRLPIGKKGTFVSGAGVDLLSMTIESSGLSFTGTGTGYYIELGYEQMLSESLFTTTNLDYVSGDVNLLGIDLPADSVVLAFGLGYKLN